MVYSKSWDEGAPAGSADASTLDTVIQDLKISIRERLEDILPDWSNDGVDPKVIDSTLFPDTITDHERVAVKLTSFESIPTATPTSIPWDSTIFESGEMWDAGDPTKIVIPTTGLYLVTCNLAWFALSDPTGYRQAILYKYPLGGVIPNQLAKHVTEVSGVSSGGANHISWFGSLAATDELGITVQQNSGGALDLYAIDEQCSFSAIRLV